MGGAASVVKGGVLSVTGLETGYDGYVCGHSQGQELDRKLKLLGVSRAGAVGLYEEFKRLDDINTGDITPKDILEKLKVKDLSNTFMERACASFRNEAGADGSSLVKLNAADFILGVFCYTTLNKLELGVFAFRLYDTRSRGKLESDDLRLMMQEIFGAVQWETPYKMVMEQTQRITKTMQQVNDEKDPGQARDSDGNVMLLKPIKYEEFLERAIERVSLVLKPVFLLQQTFRSALMTPLWWRQAESHLRRRCEPYAPHDSCVPFVATLAGLACAAHITSPLILIYSKAQRLRVSMLYMLSISGRPLLATRTSGESPRKKATGGAKRRLCMEASGSHGSAPVGTQRVKNTVRIGASVRVREDDMDMGDAPSGAAMVPTPVVGSKKVRKGGDAYDSASVARRHTTRVSADGSANHPDESRTENPAYDSTASHRTSNMRTVSVYSARPSAAAACAAAAASAAAAAAAHCELRTLACKSSRPSVVPGSAAAAAAAAAVALPALRKQSVAVAQHHYRDSAAAGGGGGGGGGRDDGAGTVRKRVSAEAASGTGIPRTASTPQRCR
ncbi:hypothetical protein JKP88DRAFT_246227 [Tribonema minus]|uniref:EF-hand domain-containing protein n=1 Tax=Tribonema minus TaxID=303371 RepID=A0A836CDB7_9STRA|nr:hypothetical protein JKP88DRAFT_246227 [Tribonema minus]